MYKTCRRVGTYFIVVMVLLIFLAIVNPFGALTALFDLTPPFLRPDWDLVGKLTTIYIVGLFTINTFSFVFDIFYTKFKDKRYLDRDTMKSMLEEENKAYSKVLEVVHNMVFKSVNKEDKTEDNIFKLKAALLNMELNLYYLNSRLGKK